MDRQTLHKTAFMQFQDNQLDQALKNYLQILEADPTDISAASLAGDIVARQNLIPEAIRYYFQASQQALLQKAQGRLEGLRKKMLGLDPNYAEDIQPEPVLGSVSEALSRSIDEVKKNLAADPKNIDSLQKLADLLLQAGRNKEASALLMTMANAYYNSKNSAKASETLQQIIQNDPNFILAHVALGEIFSKEGADSDAKKEFLFVAGEYLRQGNMERGQFFAQKAIQLKSIEAHYYLGLYYFLNQDMENARKEFETLLKFKLKHQAGLNLLAKIMMAARQWDDAKKLLERLIGIDNQNGEVYEQLAAIARLENNAEAAILFYNQAIHAYAHFEEWERVAFCAKQGIDLNSRNQEMYLKLADAAYNAGLLELAADTCKALGDVLESEGKTQEAATMRAKARELSGESPAPVPIAAVASAALVADTKPKTVATPQAPSAAPKPVADVANETQVMMNIADNYIQQGSLDEAIEIYQKILKKEPNNEKVKSALTRVYAMFAGINPETAVSRKTTPSGSKGIDEREDQRVQREARERAQREAQVRAQRSSTPSATPVKSGVKENELTQSIGNARGDEIDGDNQDEFMTVTVAEIYTKQGLLNEALKIYQKILEIEPGNMEAQVKKQELENKMAEQERISQATQKLVAESAEKAKAIAENKKNAAELPLAATPKAAAIGGENPAPAATAPTANTPNDKNDPEPPTARGKKGRVSYV